MDTPTLPHASTVPAAILQQLGHLGDAALRALGSPHETLTHEERGPYLEKWHLARQPDGSASLIHRFLRSDGDDELHDHPWDNRTLMISDGYWEVTANGRRWIAPGDIVVRKATDFHRIELEPGTTPVTLFWHGPRTNQWGFLGHDGIKVAAAEFLATSKAMRDLGQSRL